MDAPDSGVVYPNRGWGAAPHSPRTSHRVAGTDQGRPHPPKTCTRRNTLGLFNNELEPIGSRLIGEINVI